MKIKFKYKIIIILFTILLFCVCDKQLGSVDASWTSYNIRDIDESKFPGYKNQIQTMQSQYPNWTFKLLYTGLDWNTVISEEDKVINGTPRSLIYDTYTGEWINGTTKYDVSKRWYRASQKAIAYMMDPRNSLTANYVFQFQDLSSSKGTKDEIMKMTEGTFLHNDECVDAIIEAAQTEGISPFHLVERIRLEQGTAGTGKMNGYAYTNENGQIRTVYNLFNINVTGNDTSAALLAGAKYAYDNGWFTKAASIKGGAKFVKEGYINVGQSTLYFQKYDVIEQGGLYNHQYMQNIRAANDEGNAMYRGYVSNGIETGHFEFTIPMYENMPAQVASRPLNESDIYSGDINSKIEELNVLNDSTYISGKIVITEWVNGQSTVPRTLPKMTIESTDGTVKEELYVAQESGNTYYFDKNISALDKTKTYIIKAELTESVNISDNKTMTVNLGTRTFENSNIYTKNDNLYLGTYLDGLTHELLDISLNKNDSNASYISGTVMAIELINEDSTVPKTTPKMTLSSTDGTTNYSMFVNYTEKNNYYFDLFVDHINTGKEYTIQLELTEDNNNSTEKKNTLNISDMTLGELKNRTMLVKDNKIIFQYEGSIKTELKKLELHKNSETSYYINGELNIEEIINSQSTVPETLPKLTLESTDGTVKQEMYIKQNSGNEYYFDTYISEIDRSKEYQIVAELTGTNNNSTNKKEIISIGNKTLGKIEKVDIVVEDNKIKYQYDGELTNQIYSLELNRTLGGAYYISGEIMAIEWVNGESTVPLDKPKMTLVSEDEKTIMETFITSTGTNTYYFDKFIDEIDTTKNYKIEIELTTPYNISISKSNIVDLSKLNKNLGNYNNYKMNIKDNQITFEDSSYKGDVNTELRQFNLGNSNGYSYISGEIVVVEWVNGESTVPKIAPKMRFQSTDTEEKVDMEVFVTATGTNTYYFDRFIEGIDTTKEYTFTVESGDANNVSEYRVVPVYFRGNFLNKVIGTYKGKELALENHKIVFKDIDTTYKGDVNTELRQFNLGNSNGYSYISGEIVVVEWVNGQSTVPKVAPKMRFQSTDTEEKVDMEVFVVATGTNTYYFDRFIEGIDTTKSYKFIVESGDANNVSEYRVVPVYFRGEFSNKIIGNYHQKTMILEDNMIRFK